MRKITATAGSALFLVIAPGVVAGLVPYATVAGAAFVAFVHGYEQPTLARRCGAQYEAYRRAVPGWRPRLPPARKNPQP